MLLVAMPGAPSSVLGPSSKARMPLVVMPLLLVARLLLVSDARSFLLVASPWS